jgi:hypothetical protein
MKIMIPTALVIDGDYKIVVSHPDYISYGADWENCTNGQGWRKRREMGFGTVVSCDSPRVYHSVTVRNAGINPTPEYCVTGPAAGYTCIRRVWNGQGR